MSSRLPPAAGCVDRRVQRACFTGSDVVSVCVVTGEPLHQRLSRLVRTHAHVRHQRLHPVESRRQGNSARRRVASSSRARAVVACVRQQRQCCVELERAGNVDSSRTGNVDSGR